MWAVTKKLGGGNSKIFDVHPYLGKMNPFWLIFFKGVETSSGPTRTAWLFAKYIRDEIWLTSHMNIFGPLPVMNGLGTSNPSLQMAEHQWVKLGWKLTPL